MASLAASFRSARSSSGASLTATRAAVSAMRTTTTSTSMSVKPASALAASVVNVGVVAFAAGLTVRTVAEHIDLTMGSRVDVLIVAAPGILRHAVQISPRFPVKRQRVGRRLGNQGGKALLCRGIDGVVQAVEVQGLDHGGDVRLGGDHPGFVRAAHHLWNDNGREQTENHHHDHHLDQGEAPCRAFEYRLYGHNT